MVEVLEPYSQALTSIKQDLPNILRQILIDEKETVLNILKDEQLSKGLDADGNVVGTYSRSTEIESIFGEVKPRKPKIEGQPYNFEWTGGFFDKMDVMFEDLKSYTLFSRDEKAKFLNEQYGNIDTLSQSNNERVNNEVLRPKMFERIIERLYVWYCI